MPVFFFIVDGRINPVAVKVLCKVDNVLLYTSGACGDMAVTKIKPIKSTLSKALDYIENPDKTDGKMLRCV